MEGIGNTRSPRRRSVGSRRRHVNWSGFRTTEPRLFCEVFLRSLATPCSLGLTDVMLLLPCAHPVPVDWNGCSLFLSLSLSFFFILFSLSLVQWLFSYLPFFLLCVIWIGMYACSLCVCVCLFVYPCVCICGLTCLFGYLLVCLCVSKWMSIHFFCKCTSSIKITIFICL